LTAAGPRWIGPVCAVPGVPVLASAFAYALYLVDAGAALALVGVALVTLRPTRAGVYN
jgi:hypothetical protein